MKTLQDQLPATTKHEAVNTRIGTNPKTAYRSLDPKNGHTRTGHQTHQHTPPGRVKATTSREVVCLGERNVYGIGAIGYNASPGEAVKIPAPKYVLPYPDGVGELNCWK